MESDLVSKLRSVLHRNGVHQRQPAAANDSQVTLAYLSKALLDDDEEMDLMQQQESSLQGLVDEFAQIVSPRISESSSSAMGNGLLYSSNEELESSLRKCARALAANDLANFYILERQIRADAAPQATPIQKTAMFFLDALLARLQGTGPQACGRLSAGITSRQMTGAKLPSFKVGAMFANDVILRACAGAKRVHIVDYGVSSGVQWPSLIKALAARPEGPPRLKITGIELVRAAEVAATREYLADYARSNGVVFEYVGIVSDSWEAVQPAVQKDEVLIVNSTLRLRHMKDEWKAVGNPRLTLLRKFCRMRPKVFVMSVSSTSTSPFFLQNFDHMLKHYVAKLECLSAKLENELLEMVEKMFQRSIMNTVACHGLDQLERPERYTIWGARAKQAGLQPFPVDQEIFKKVKLTWGAHKENFRCQIDENWMVLGWKDVTLCGLSAWQTA